MIDVLVVGAGPAGSTAARVLARSGAKVTLLDKHRFPRQKPCGGAISLRALKRFPEVASSLPRIPTHYVARLVLEGPGGRSTTIESLNPVVLMIRRIEFDHLLVELACDAGADLREGVEITQATLGDGYVRLKDRCGGSLDAKFVIAADGVNSVVARRLGLNSGWRKSQVALDMMEETPNEQLRACDPNAIWVSYGPNGTHGYSYVFPKRDHVNVGTGRLLSYFRGAGLERPYAMQTQLVDSLVAKRFLHGRSNRGNFTPFLIPVGGPLAARGLDRVLVAGDAGGFVNGYTAEGIFYAMVSGDLAARAVASDRGTAPETYAKAWQAEMGAELRDAVLLQKFLFGRRDRIDGIVKGAETRHDVVGGLLDYAAGTSTYFAARRNLFIQTPTFAPRLLWSALTDRHHTI